MTPQQNANRLGYLADRLAMHESLGGSRDAMIRGALLDGEITEREASILRHPLSRRTLAEVIPLPVNEEAFAALSPVERATLKLVERNPLK